MYAIIGGSIIVFGSVFIGFSMIASVNRQIKILSELIEFIRFSEMKISCFGTPVGEICRSFDAKLLKELFAQAAREGLPDALAAHTDELLLTEKSARTLRDFAAAFGRTSAEEQINNCVWARGELFHECEELSIRQPARIKLYSVCSVIFGLMLVIIII